MDLDKIYRSHTKLPEDIRNIPWRFDCKGCVLCQDVQICDCQGSMEMARLIATVHNQILKEMDKMSELDWARLIGHTWNY